MNVDLTPDQTKSENLCQSLQKSSHKDHDFTRRKDMEINILILVKNKDLWEIISRVQEKCPNNKNF